jgi:membrane associated rhomboid family serine protease
MLSHLRALPNVYHLRKFHVSKLLFEKRWTRWEWPVDTERHRFQYPWNQKDMNDYENAPHDSFSFFRDVCVTTAASLMIILGIYGFSSWYERRLRKKMMETKIRKLSYLLPHKMKYSYSWKDVHSWKDFKDYVRFVYLNTPNATIVSIVLVSLNAGIFFLWKVPNSRLQLWMYQHFIHHVHKPSLVSQIVSIPLCTFSHSDGYHILFNMIAATSFAHVLLHDISMPHFWSFYLSVGILSTLSSHLFKYMTKSNIGSLGASGAIMGIIGYTISRFYHTDPERKFVSLIFLPFIQFNAQQALYALLAMELGMFLFSKRVRIDHVAHLSGLALGWWYYNQGKNRISPLFYK